MRAIMISQNDCWLRFGGRREVLYVLAAKSVVGNSLNDHGEFTAHE